MAVTTAVSPHVALISNIRSEMRRLESRLQMELYRADQIFWQQVCTVISKGKVPWEIQIGAADAINEKAALRPNFTIEDDDLCKKVRKIVQKSDRLHVLPDSDTVHLSYGLMLYLDDSRGLIRLSAKSASCGGPKNLTDMLMRMKRLGLLACGVRKEQIVALTLKLQRQINDVDRAATAVLEAVWGVQNA